MMSLSVRGKDMAVNSSVFFVLHPIELKLVYGSILGSCLRIWTKNVHCLTIMLQHLRALVMES